MFGQFGKISWVNLEIKSNEDKYNEVNATTEGFLNFTRGKR